MRVHINTWHAHKIHTFSTWQSQTHIIKTCPPFHALCIHQFLTWQSQMLLDTIDSSYAPASTEHTHTTISLQGSRPSKLLFHSQRVFEDVGLIQHEIPVRKTMNSTTKLYLPNKLCRLGLFFVLLHSLKEFVPIDA